MTKRKQEVPQWSEELHELNDQALTADGFDAAYVGWIDDHWNPKRTGPVAVYSYAQCIKVLMKQGMSHEEAEEYFEFNVVGAYVGPGTPMFLVEREDRKR